ncbi:Cystathionine gamma-synthase [Salvia divinorum]|uniref:Cystathionine gamma-synthase n=1 Tax=Salvia divinorum TaxID=28513 RepID=A0ABD1FIT6_SALDI
MKDDGPDAVIDIAKPVNLAGGLEFSNLTYTVIKKVKDVNGNWVKQEADLLHNITGYAARGCITAVMGPAPESRHFWTDDRLFPMLTVYETLMFAADFRLGSMSTADKRQRVEQLIEKLGLSSSRNTYIGDEGRRGVSGGERRRVTIGVGIIHGPSLLFLDEPTSGLDSTSAHSVMERVHDIARSGSTVVLTIHQPSSRIEVLLDRVIVLARGQLMYQGAPRDVVGHLGRIGLKVSKSENPMEYFIDVVQEYDRSDLGVEALAEFALTGVRPPLLVAYEEMSASTELPQPKRGSHKQAAGGSRALAKNSPTPVYYAYSSEILQGTPTPHSSDRTLNEDDYMTDSMVHPIATEAYRKLTPKFANSFLPETWILMRRNFINITRTPELFVSRLFVLAIMGFMMATMFWHPKNNTQGITDRVSFFIFTVCLFFFSSNDAVPAFIQERFVFIRETSHNAYRASSYTVACLITYLPFLALQAALYAVIVWLPLQLDGAFGYFLLVLYVSLISTNSFVVFVSAVVPNYIVGYAAVIACTALFFLFCGYFLSSHAMPRYWKWMYYVSTMTYPYEGLLMNEYQQNKTFGNVPGNSILESLGIGIEHNLKWHKVYAILGWAVLYRVLFYIVLRFFSKNQRK